MASTVWGAASLIAARSDWSPDEFYRWLEKHEPPSRSAHAIYGRHYAPHKRTIRAHRNDKLGALSGASPSCQRRQPPISGGTIPSSPRPVNRNSIRFEPNPFPKQGARRSVLPRQHLGRNRAWRDICYSSWCPRTASARDQASRSSI